MRIRELLETKTPKAEAPKPRNFVAKNAIQSGAGAHKDKKRAAKQGNVKHKNKFNYRQDDWSQDFERRMKEGVAEDQVDEGKGYNFVQNLVDKFYDDNGIEWSNGNIYVKDPGTRVWTRGDGTRYRDPGKITTKDGSNEKQLKAFFPWLIKQPGVKHLGKISGEFASDEKTDVYAIGGIYFTQKGHSVIHWGSVSRFKNPRSVWKQQPKTADVGEGTKDYCDACDSVITTRPHICPGTEGVAETANDLRKKSTASLQAFWNKHKDEPGASPVFAQQLRAVAKELARRKKQGVAETATAGATSAGNVAVGAVYPNKKGKTFKNKDGTVKNALDVKGANLMTGGSIKR
jgi:hypothetical protein